MLIKSVRKNGDPVAMSPEECVPYAITYGLKEQDQSEWVMWAMAKTVKLSDKVVVTPGDNNSWEAIAQGTVAIGKTHVKTDKFYVTKPHTFKVHYKSKKDILGLPDIEVVDFSFDQIGQNPSDNVGPAPQNPPVTEQFQVQSGELSPAPEQLQSRPVAPRYQKPVRK